MTGLVESLDRTIADVCLWCHAHPGRWRAWPISYSSAHDAERDLERHQYGEVAEFQCDPAAFRWQRAHRTFLDADGRYRVRVMLLW